MPSDVVLCYTTFPNKDEALAVSKKLLEEKLIACANILPSGISLYIWEGKTETADEVAVLLKTLKSKTSALQERYLQLHSYDCPCFLELSVVDGAPEYTQWIKTSLL